MYRLILPIPLPLTFAPSAPYALASQRQGFKENKSKTFVATFTKVKLYDFLFFNSLYLYILRELITFN